MLRNNGNRGAVKLRGGWVIGGEWTQSLAEIPSCRRGGQVVADYKYTRSKWWQKEYIYTIHTSLNFDSGIEFFNVI